MAERDVVVQRVVIGAVMLGLVFGLFWLDAELSKRVAGPIATSVPEAVGAEPQPPAAPQVSPLEDLLAPLTGYGTRSGAPGDATADTQAAEAPAEEPGSTADEPAAEQGPDPSETYDATIQGQEPYPDEYDVVGDPEEPPPAVGWEWLLCHGALITLVAAGLVAMATWEVVGLCRSAGMQPVGGWAVLMAVLLALHPWVVANLLGSEFVGDATILLVIVALVGSVLAVMSRQRTQGAVQDVAATWLAAMYIGFLASFAVQMRQVFVGPAGAWLLLYFIAILKFTDIFAYATGMLFGRHKLIPWLSPGKTYEGLAGGLAGAALTAVVFLYALVGFGIIGPVENPDMPGTIYVWAALVGAVLGGLGQAGDLMESLLKRGAGQKDSAKLLPGFGGVFDLLDSLLVAAPAALVVFLRLF